MPIRSVDDCTVGGHGAPAAAAHRVPDGPSNEDTQEGESAPREAASAEQVHGIQARGQICGRDEQQRPAPGTRALGRGGHRLAEAFAAVERLPVLVESQRRLRALTAKPSIPEAEVTETVEADVGVVIAVLRGASNGNGPMGPVWGVGTPSRR
jgi:hypothetical protein